MALSWVMCRSRKARESERDRQTGRQAVTQLDRQRHRQTGRDTVSDLSCSLVFTKNPPNIHTNLNLSWARPFWNAIDTTDANKAATFLRYHHSHCYDQCWTVHTSQIRGVRIKCVYMYMRVMQVGERNTPNSQIQGYYIKAKIKSYPPSHSQSSLQRNIYHVVMFQLAIWYIQLKNEFSFDLCRQTFFLWQVLKGGESFFIEQEGRKVEINTRN